MIRPAPLLLLMAGLTATFVFSTAAAASSKTSSSSAAAAPLPSPSTATVSNGSPTPATSAAATNVSSNNINRPKAMAPQTIATTVNTAVNASPTSPPSDRFPFLEPLRRRYSHQPTFLQAVEEMALALQPLFSDPKRESFYLRAFLVMTEPERTVSFRVPWTDDSGHLQHNRGWRVEFNSALGPYKGGLRFHPTVDEGVLKFLGFEQVFKNALTGLPLGGGKGGSDFDPRGRSAGEVRRFCESFMAELHRHLHPSTDVPAGDIGVGGREIGYLYGQYKRLTNRHGEAVLTGKGLAIGGSHVRPEATGYGLVYLSDLAIEGRGGARSDDGSSGSSGRPPIQSLKGARCAVSGSGNVAQYAARKLLDLGARVMTVSDSDGVLVFPEGGMTERDWEVVTDAKQNRRVRLSAIEGEVTGRYVAGETPWSVDVAYDYAYPCATQNEVDGEGARRMVRGGLLGLFEGANLPTTMEGQEVLRASGALYVPGKASNAGGVGVSGFEMSQNAQRLRWTEEEVDGRLRDLMAGIYEQMTSVPGEAVTLEQGANRAGFLKVAKAMEELGWVY